MFGKLPVGERVNVSGRNINKSLTESRIFSFAFFLFFYLFLFIFLFIIIKFRNMLTLTGNNKRSLN